jgi:Putative peptidoglycan binding domain
MSVDPTGNPASPPGSFPYSDEAFRNSIDGLSRSLGERATRHPDPVGEATLRRVRVQAYFRSRARRLKMLAAGTAAALAAAGVAAFIVLAAGPFDSSAPVRVAAADPVASPKPVVQSVAAVQAVAPPVVVQPTAPQPAPVDLASILPPPPPPAPPVEIAAADLVPPQTLQRAEIVEAQQRLWAFGFNPGPVDGNAGRMTEGAVMHYQQERGRIQTGMLDRDVLEQLRHDPAPKAVAQRSSRQYDSQRQASAARSQSSSPLGFVRTASDNLSRWFNSIGH